jgi:hypothetical protein
VVTVAVFGLAPGAAAAGAGRPGGAAVATVPRAWQARPSAGAAGLNPLDGAWFDGVSCVSATACVAVGQKNIKAADQLPLAERWNGRRWLIQSTPGAPRLIAVSCPSRTACAAIGVTDGAEAWNGKSWVRQRVLAVALP